MVACRNRSLTVAAPAIVATVGILLFLANFTPHFPLAYLITMSSKGSWLHGNQWQSVDRDHNQFGEPFVEANVAREKYERTLCAEVTFTLEQVRVIDTTVREVCAYKEWELRALNVRLQHAHLVVSAQSEPEPVMNSLKSWCTRRMTEHGCWVRGEHPWARHGSTPYLWTAVSVERAVKYVMEEQGTPLV